MVNSDLSSKLIMLILALHFVVGFGLQTIS